MTQQCIWCKKTDVNTAFNKKPHTIPKSMGGKRIGKDVCDECNLFFGIHDKLKNPAIEVVLKETFVLTQTMLLHVAPPIKNTKPQKLPRFKSIFFKVKPDKRTFSLKPAFKHQSGFQKMLCKKLKQGLYKVFLEEFHLENDLGLNSQFDFIRDFARNNKNDLPVYYFERKHGAILSSPNLVLNPRISTFDNKDYIIEKYGFFEFELLGHVFSIPIKKHPNKEGYLLNWKKLNGDLFYGLREINYLKDIDFMLKILVL